jgi:hypothetical protein
LPVRRGLQPVYALSIIIAVLMAVASITGVLYRVRVYPTDDLLQSFVPNGLVNLLVGLLLWPGALFFVLYNYLIYVLAMPLSETQVTETELAAHVADYLIAPALAIGGVLLWRHIQFG